MIYVGEQTTLNQNQQFGTLDTTTDPKAANVVAIDLASVAANGYTDKSGAVLKTAADSTVTVRASEDRATYSVDLLNLNSKVLTITETGASLNLGKALAAADVVMLHNAFYADGKVAADGTFAVVTDEEAVLEVETSGLHTAGAVVQAVRSYEKPTNGIAAIVYNNWKAWDQEYNQAYFDQAKAAGLLKDTATLDTATCTVGAVAPTVCFSTTRESSCLASSDRNAEALVSKVVRSGRRAACALAAGSSKPSCAPFLTRCASSISSLSNRRQPSTAAKNRCMVKARTGS